MTTAGEGWFTARIMEAAAVSDDPLAADPLAQQIRAASHEAAIQRAVEMGRKNRVHPAVEMEPGVCYCGKRLGHRLHAVPPPAALPQPIVTFHPGDKVMCPDGFVASVQSASEHMICVEDEHERTQWFRPDDLKKLVKPPKFTSVEEAERWLEDNA